MVTASASADRPFRQERAGGMVISIEICLYAVALLVGAALRLAALSAPALQAEEGGRALAAWQLVQGVTPQIWREPLVEVLAGLGFFLFGDNDFMARLAPTFAGTALIGLPWLLRGVIGRGGALIAAGLIAFSPSFIFYSRFLSGDIFAAVLAVLLVALAADWLRSPDKSGSRSLFGVLIALALLLNSGGSAIWYLLVFFAYGAAVLALGWWDLKDILPGPKSRAAQDGSLGQRISALPRETRRAILYGLALFVGVFLAAASGLFLNAYGLGLPAVGEWIRQFSPAPGGPPWYYNVLVLFTYEPLATIFGVMGAVYLLRRKAGPFYRFLAFWAGLAFIMVSLASAKSSAQTLVVVLPLCLLAGGFLGQLRLRWDSTLLRKTLYFLLPALVLLSFVVIGTSFLSNRVASLPSYLWLVSGFSMIAVLGLILLAARQDKWQGAPLSILTVVGLLFLFSIHVIWSLNYRLSPAEWFAPAQTSRDATGLIASLGPVLEGKDKKVAVDSSLAPVLGWYLRGKTGVYYVDKLVAGEAVLIAPDAKPLEGAGENYGKQRRYLKSTWFPEGFAPETAWRWVMFRETYGPVRSESVAVYQRK